MAEEEREGAEGEEEDEGDPEFPDELNELLEYCVGEHGDNFDAISRDFLDIAKDLEDPLAARATEFFSPEALRRRWMYLCELCGVKFEESFPESAVDGDEGDERGMVEDGAGGSAGSGEAAAATAAPASSQQAAGSTVPLRSVEATVSAPVPVASGPAPSSFSIFTDSLKGQIDRIYLDVQNRLPTAAIDDDEDDDDDGGSSVGDPAGASTPLGGARGSAGGGASSSSAPPPGAAEVAEGAGEGARSASAPASGKGAAGAPGASGATGAVPLSPTWREGSPHPCTSGSEEGYPQLDPLDSESEELRQQTIRLFGTDDLRKILKSEEIKASSSAAALLPDHELLAETSDDGTGSPPLAVRAAAAAAAAKAVAATAGGKSTSTPPLPKSADAAVAVAAGGKGSRKGRPTVADRAEAAERSSGDDSDGGSSGSDGGRSGDSIDVDFAAARRAMKSSSLDMVSKPPAEASSKPPPASSSASAKAAAFSPPPRVAAKAGAAAKSSASQQASQQRPAQKFVKLELVESSSEGSEEEEEEEDEDPNVGGRKGKAKAKGVEGGGSDEEEEDGDFPVGFGGDDDSQSIHITAYLLKRAPDGECPWDMWLDLAHKWPRLQVKLGSPDFFRRGDELRVRFDAVRLREVHEEEKRERDERRQRRKNDEERRRLGAAEFVKEAERRREMMGGRFGGGFVLLSNRHQDRSSNVKGDAKDDESSEDEEAKAREKKVQEEAAEKERLKQVEEERARTAEEAAREKEAKRREAAERALERRKEELLAEALRKRWPLCDRGFSFGELIEPLAPGAEGGAADASLEIYVLPWGRPRSEVGVDGAAAAAAAPEPEQCEALGLVHALGAASALLLVSSDDALSGLGPGVAEALEVKAAQSSAGAGTGTPSAAVAMLLKSSEVRAASGQRLPSGKRFGDSLLGPFPWSPAGQLFKRPFALFAGSDAGASVAGRPRQQQPLLPHALGEPELEAETVCISLRAGGGGSAVTAEALATVLAEAYDEGLCVVGMRMVFPEASASSQGVTSGAMRSVVRNGKPVLLVALRGPHALSVWRGMLGPADPVLARRTDPASLNARFGGDSRTETLCLAPPSSAARAHTDVAWAFGGRIDAASPSGHRRLSEEAPTLEPLHALRIPEPAAYAVELDGQLDFASAGSMLSGFLLRMGRIIGLSATAASGRERLVAVAVREGGGAFVPHCGRLLTAPELDRMGHLDMPRSPSGAAPSSPSGASRRRGSLDPPTARVCQVPQRFGLALTSEIRPLVPTSEEACRLGEPEVLVLGLRPSGGEGTALLLRDVLEGMYARFGPDGHAPSGRPLSAGLHVGGVVDLIAVRAMDFGFIPSCDVTASVLDALRGFRNFSQTMQRTAAASTDGWWLPEGSGWPAVFLAFRGDGLLARFSAFLCKEWKLPAATGGGVLFTPTVPAARQAFLALFPASSAAPAFAPSLPPSDLGALSRFESLAPASRARGAGGGRAAAGLRLSEACLFPQRLVPQLTVALLPPPKLDTVLSRVLLACEQHELSLVAAELGGGLSRATARLLYEQEVADDHLEPEEWEAFAASVGCRLDDAAGEAAAMEGDDGEFRCLWLVLSRHQAVKRFAQLCGHSDPAVNQEYLHASIRSGRDRIQNGVRCSTSAATAEELLELLGRDLAQSWPSTAAWPPSASLGVEESERLLECSFVAIGLPPMQPHKGSQTSTASTSASPASLGLARTLCDLHAGLEKEGLHIVGLRALDAQQASAASSCAGGGAAGGGSAEQTVAWPRASPRCQEELLVRFRAARPEAAPVADAALAPGGRMLIAAAEGPAGCERARRAVAAVAAASPKGCGLAWYASPCAGEAVADVACFFSELYGGKHYVVPGGD